MKKYIVFCWILISILSCETTVEIDVEPHEPRMVAYAYWVVGDSELPLQLGYSSGYLNTGDPGLLNNASADLAKNGGVAVPLLTTGEVGEYSAIYNLEDVPGDEFRIEISHPDYPTAYANAVVPTKVGIDDLRFVGESYDVEYEQDVDQYEITFTDPLGEENFYALDFIIDDGFGNTHRERMTIVDPRMVRGPKKEVLIASDLHADGSVATYIIGLPDIEQLRMYNEHPEATATLRLKSISRDRYLYAKSYRDYNQSDDNPFAEPVTVHSNIENGFGIFSIEQVHETILEW